MVLKRFVAILAAACIAGCASGPVRFAEAEPPVAEQAPAEGVSWGWWLLGALVVGAIAAADSAKGEQETGPTIEGGPGGCVADEVCFGPPGGG